MRPKRRCENHRLELRIVSTLARSEDTLVFTSDPNDIAHLADALGARIRLELV